jgi:GT2 family glycosyltransferase
MVSAVIPNFNGQRLLRRYLPAVIACLRSGDELLIVDDASTDSSVAWLVDTFRLKPHSTTSLFSSWQGMIRQQTKDLTATVIKNTDNLRFGASCNRGVEQAQGDIILLFNNDVKPRSSVLNFLLPHFQDKTVFAVGCAELEPISPRSKEFRLGGKNKLWFERGLFVHSRATEFSSGETAWVSGGSGAFDRSKWLALGGFAPDFYPAYWEDVDLSFRARQRGWKVLFERQAEVEHHHETTNQSAFGQRNIFTMSWRHAQVFVWKNGTWVQKIANILWKPYHWYFWLKQRIAG